MKFENKFYNRGDCIDTSSETIILESKKAFGSGFIVLAVVRRNRNYMVFFMTEEKNLMHGDAFHDLLSALAIFNERG